MTNFWLKRQYAESSTEPDGLAKRGFVYLLGKKFTINGTSTVDLCLTTPALLVVFEFFTIGSTSAELYAELIEGATVTKSTSAGVGYNLNRNYPDNHESVFSNVTSATGGTTVAEELVLSSNNVAWDATDARVHILRPSSDYVMRFANLGNQATTCHFQLGWTEMEPTPKELWTA